jgi:dTDP-4-amino-4,6-dideoxygalactose transaminase
MNTMKAQGIQTSIHYPIIPDFQLYRRTSRQEEAIPLIRKWVPREVTLPLYAGMQEEQVEYVVSAVQEAIICGNNLL